MAETATGIRYRAFGPDHLGRRIFGPPAGRLSALLIGAIFLVSAFFCAPVQAKIEIPLEKPIIARMPIAIPDFSSSRPGSFNGSDLAGILRRDLYVTGLFDVQNAAAAPEEAGSPAPDFAKWAQAGAQTLVLGVFNVEGDMLVLEAKLYDVAMQKMLLGKRLTGALRDHRQLVHRFADRVLEKLTGAPGCFTSRIAFVAAAESREIFVMDIDGHNLQQATRNGSINLSPEWSRDGKRVIFTSYLRYKPDLWALELDGLKQWSISARPGINASARYSPDGQEIALSMTFKGIPKLFIISPQGDIIKRLTDGRGNDISPTWSPDRSTIAFVSDQAGTPQVYTIPVQGGEPKRLTFNNNYNTDPDWSPNGDLLVYTSRVGGRLQICTIRTDGSDQKVLTDKGSNESPAWSPDARMIAFSSDRDGKKRIYLMDAQGQVPVPISPIPGKSPAWSPPMR